MGNSDNPSGTRMINNLTSPKYLIIATAIEKYLWLAYSLSLFLERKELIEVPLRENAISSKEKGREYQYSRIGADQLVVVSCADLRLWKLSHSEGADGFEVISELLT